jgi:EAL domain-containing protein (putative c-di-GMP-specific phosphodiesterase class I)
VAEFVPDEETASLLRKVGVDSAQGYHIGKPRPITEVLPTGSSSLGSLGRAGSSWADRTRANPGET